MVVRKQKKVSKYRASTTHGGGHRKKRRGAGSRGGRGNAGTGKKAGQKKAGRAPSLGAKGFKMHRSIAKPRTVNISYFTAERLASLVEAKLASKKAEVYTVELASLGFQKLLGTGSISLAVQFKSKQWSAKAEEKVTAAGGSIQAVAVESSAEVKKVAETQKTEAVDTSAEK
ncbi:50S ribosomal protein L15 [archaeon]|nr:50S ribosomal protein L15 [archaeon]|tara:strand:- start:245 stop:760 length:516 start_codon:yes stop_codon:yes gene_type:complete